jgi:hypothetical protein
VVPVSSHAQRQAAIVEAIILDAFEHCGDHGSYKDFKDATGIGFSPYIYHAIQYNFVITL